MSRVKCAGVVLVVVVLHVSASPAFAAVPQVASAAFPASMVAVSAAAPASPPVPPPYVEPVQNKAGVREMLKASGSARAGLKAVESASGLIDRMEAGLADGTLSPRAAEKLQRRIDAAMGKVGSLFFQAEELAARAYALHEEASGRIADSGRQPLDAPAWAAAVSAYETAIDSLLEALSTVPGTVVPVPR